MGKLVKYRLWDHWYDKQYEYIVVEIITLGQSLLKFYWKENRANKKL